MFNLDELGRKWLLFFFPHSFIGILLWIILAFFLSLILCILLYFNCFKDNQNLYDLHEEMHFFDLFLV